MNSLAFFRMMDGYDIEDLAKYLGVSKDEYIAYERGHLELSITVLERLSKLYRIKSESLEKAPRNAAESELL